MSLPNIQKLNLSNSSAIELKSYAFKPKGGDAKLVLVVAEPDKDIGKASALAKLLGEGIKDLRAADDALVEETLGTNRAQGELGPIKCTSGVAFSNVLNVHSRSSSCRQVKSHRSPSRSIFFHSVLFFGICHRPINLPAYHF